MPMPPPLHGPHASPPPPPRKVDPLPGFKAQDWQTASLEMRLEMLAASIRDLHAKVDRLDRDDRTEF